MTISKESRSFFNVILLGFGFMFLSVSFVTLGDIQKYVIRKLRKENPKFHGKGFLNLCVLYGSFAISHCVSPFVSSRPRICLITGATCQLLYQAQFLFPKDWVLYATSVICGFGGCLLWAAREQYIIENSTKETILRNNIISFILTQMGRTFCTFFIYIKDYVHPMASDETKRLFYGMIFTSFLALVIFTCLCKAVYRSKRPKNVKNLLLTLEVASWKNMLIMTPIFIYSGLMLAFHSAVYGNCIMYTKFDICMHLDTIALSAFCCSLGILIGATFFGLYGHKLTIRGKYPIIIFGLIVHITSFICIYINLPETSLRECSLPVGIIPSNFDLAMVCSFLLGFGDACFVTQTYGIISDAFKHKVQQSHAVYKYVQTFSASIMFLFATYVDLWNILGMLIFFSIFATVCFCVLERRIRYYMAEDRSLEDELAVDYWFT